MGVGDQVNQLMEPWGARFWKTMQFPRETSEMGTCGSAISYLDAVGRGVSVKTVTCFHTGAD